MFSLPNVLTTERFLQFQQFQSLIDNLSILILFSCLKNRKQRKKKKTSCMKSPVYRSTVLKNCFKKAIYSNVFQLYNDVNDGIWKTSL